MNNDNIQGRVQVFLMNEKIKQLKRQQRDMELRYAIRELSEEYRDQKSGKTQTRDSRGRYKYAGGSKKKGLTKHNKGDTITKEDIHDLAKIIREQLYLYVNKESCIIRPYSSDYEFRVRVYGLGDFDVLEKYKAYPRGGR